MESSHGCASSFEPVCFSQRTSSATALSRTIHGGSFPITWLPFIVPAAMADRPNTAAAATRFFLDHRLKPTIVSPVQGNGQTFKEIEDAIGYASRQRRQNQSGACKSHDES
jgi:hypothetical protein